MKGNQLNISSVKHTPSGSSTALALTQQELETFVPRQDGLRIVPVLGNMRQTYLKRHVREQAFQACPQMTEEFEELVRVQFYGEALLAKAVSPLIDIMMVPAVETHPARLKQPRCGVNLSQRILTTLSYLRNHLVCGSAN